MYDFRPSTVPGCRTPHVWLDDGRSLYDAMGPDYTLLRLDPSVDVDALKSAALARRFPLEVIDVEAEEARHVYRQKLVLSRPDQHVAWRGDALPGDAFDLIDRVSGAHPPVRKPATL